ncbi:unnamed protein product, partial [Ilex paraguariensis]
HLYITVPSLFRCPISLDVMKSPVSLCTGVTYDRSSIQRWLDGGNNTCPATMQVLQTKDFVPNNTLQHLIQIWSKSAQTQSITESDSLLHSLTQDQAQILIQQINNNQNDHEICFRHVQKLIEFAKVSQENRQFLATADGFLVLFLRILDNSIKNLYVGEKIIQLCSLILENYTDREGLAKLVTQKDCLSSMVILLKQGSLESRTAVAKVLELISVDVETKILIAEQSDILSELFRIVKSESDPDGIEVGLASLICISMPKRIRIKLVRLGAVKVLGKMLSDNSDLSVLVVEKVLKLLEMISACREGRDCICEDELCIPAIVKKVLKVSTPATEHAVTILWSLCCLFRDQKAQESLSTSNGLAKILLLMQSNCSPSVRQMSGDLLKVFRVGGSKCSLSSYDTKTTHIMPF